MTDPFTPITQVNPGSQVKRIGEYRLKRPLGQGATGEVYLAINNKTGSDVVIKVLREEIPLDSYVYRKFSEEANALSRMSHPNIIKVFDFHMPSAEGDVLDRPYQVMEYLEGAVTLSQVMEQGPLAPPRVGRLLKQLGDGLGYLHAERIFHRDLKPSNILLQGMRSGEDWLKIIDLGVAAFRRSESAFRTTGMSAVGTWIYMPPEQIDRLRRRESTAEVNDEEWIAGDVFAFGAVAYRLLTGRHPFAEGLPTEGERILEMLLDRQDRGDFIDPKALCPAISAEAVDLIRQSLSRDWRERPQDIQRLGRDCSQHLQVEAAGAGAGGRGFSPSPGDVSSGRSGAVQGLGRGRHGHVLFVGLAGSSALDEKGLSLNTVREVIQKSDTWITSSDRLLTVSGDGLTAVFFSDVEAPARCALEIATSFRDKAAPPVRMGLYAGLVLNLTRHDLIGVGLSLACEVATLGTVGHILVGGQMADDLRSLSATWHRCLHDYGEHPVSTGLVRVWGLFTDTIGKREPPARRAATPIEQPQPVSPPGILSRPIIVSYAPSIDGGKGRRGETLTFAPAPVGAGGIRDRWAMKPQRVQLTAPPLEHQIAEFQSEVRELTSRAARGITNRTGSRLEDMLRRLSMAVIPPCGVSRLVGRDFHPQFLTDGYQGLTAQIPFEAFEEHYFVCTEPGCPQIVLAGGGAAQRQYCSEHGGLMLRRGGKLATHFHLTFFSDTPPNRERGGNIFLFVIDPNDDLCGPESCKAHLQAIQSGVTAMGFETRILRGPHATRATVLQMLKDESLAALYYFGHGLHDPDRGEGCLRLSDGRIYASEIAAVRPAASFVFLNGCYTAAPIRRSDFNGPNVTVAEAFGARVVLAPIDEVANTDAAQFAKDVFELLATDTTTSIGDVVRQARVRSLERFDAGRPDISWALYRYFGDPNERLPEPEAPRAQKPARVPAEGPPIQAPVAAVPAAVEPVQGIADEPEPAAVVEVERPGAGPALRSRAFEQDGRLRAEAFGFSIAAALLRAAKRRNQHRHELVSLTDFVAGMVRVGSLTRLVLTHDGEPGPDEVYQDLASKPNPSLAETTAASVATDDDEQRDDAADVQKVIASLMVRRRQDMSSLLVELLEGAGQRAEAQGGDGRISERDVLEGLIELRAWREAGLPPADVILQRLQEIQAVGEFDENGQLSVHGLNPAARKIIENAQKLAHRCGIVPIGDAVLLTAFLKDPEGLTAGLCRDQFGVDTKRLLMLALAKALPEQPSPVLSELNADAYTERVLPLLRRAKMLARTEPSNSDRSVPEITEQVLLRAYCETADADFLHWLALPPETVDLMWLTGSAPFANLDPDAMAIVDRAHELAQQVGFDSDTT